jgi:hypothetical protein
MVRLVSLGCAVALALLVNAGGASPAVSTGFLAGVTQISFGCPGPTRDGGSCNPWQPFPGARFTVARLGSDGRPIASTRRILASTPRATFRVSLLRGTYALTPLRQSQTNGGTTVKFQVRPGKATNVVVHFLGYPSMA